MVSQKLPKVLKIVADKLIEKDEADMIGPNPERTRPSDKHCHEKGLNLVIPILELIDV